MNNEVTMEPHCALKAQNTSSKIKAIINDRFGFKEVVINV